MKKTEILLIGLGVATSMSLAGCAQNCVQIAYGAGSANKYVSTSNGNILVTSPGSALASGNILRGKAVLENKTDKIQQAKYQFQWYAENGFKSGNNVPWQPVTISPHSSQVISDVAPNGRTTRYNILVCQ